MWLKTDKLISHNQEAERSKSQLNLALNQKTAVPKEGKSKTKLDRAQSKSKVKVEDSKDSLLKKSDTQSAGQRQDQVRQTLTKAVSIWFTGKFFLSFLLYLYVTFYLFGVLIFTL